MTIRPELWETVRQRAGSACEYCGVTESDVGGLLTVDHFQPRAAGGTDDLTNLLYCCNRCNQYKADYWPDKIGDLTLWNPRQEPMQSHLLPLANGTLHPVTPVGAFSAARLRLNRPALVANRLRRNAQAEERRLLERQREVLSAFRELQRYHAALLNEHRSLLEEHRALLRVLLAPDE